MTPSLKSIQALPKADLHSHIDGSIPPRALLDIARRNRRALSTPGGDDLGSVTAFMRYVEGDGYSSMLESVVDRFYPITNLMQTTETITDAGLAYVRTQKEDGVAYAEGRFAPQYHTREGLSLKEVIAVMAEGLREGAERFGVRTGLIVAIGRESSPEIGVEVARAACDSGVAVALDLGGPEAGNPPRKFKKAFALARASGLKLTVHAGEGAGSAFRNLSNIEAAIGVLGADRVGHAIDLVKDKRLVSMVRMKSTVIESNPISNLVLRKIGSLTELGIDRLLRLGVRVTVNSDDPSLWPHGRLSEVYAAVCAAYGFGPVELDTLIENSYEGAFTSDLAKEELLERYRTAKKRNG